ncbi:MAG: hypothetical protein A6F71_06975 [Cycloclasticus sp. symbiont of Poecilosclerida sp. M]|nr:MAG: hypothetical protein A6F71_06975 [Cycloclasticus sp. symbiont of Poecilosclerida sp. M]
MKCEDFKFEYIAAPNEIAGDACEHLQTCSACQPFTDKQSQFEKQITSVLQCSVPSSFRHQLREHVLSSKTFVWKKPLASVVIAASLMLAIGVVSYYPKTQGPVDRLIVQHIEYDLEESLNPSHALEALELASVEKQFGVRVNLPGQISFAEKCPIGLSFGLHMVFEDEGELMTFIYMPEIGTTETVPFIYSGLKGWIKPVKKGSLAIVGGSTLDDNYDVDRIVKSIEWL